MGETTIDGLAVRKSGARNRSVSRAKQMKPVRDTSMKPVSRNTTLALPASSDPLKHKAQTADFLEPVRSFDFDEPKTLDDDLENELLNPIVEEELGSDSGADWSDLLDELNNESGTTDWLQDDPIEEESPKKPRRAFHKKKKFPVKRTVALVMAGILLLGVWGVYQWGDGLISRLTGGNSGLMSAIWSMVSDEIPFEQDANGRTNVLVFGTEGYDMDGRVGNGQHDGAALTDSIMVISANQETKDVALLSLPRDLKVSMACSVGKINEVFWCHNRSGNNEEAGARALMQQVGEILGIEFQYYAHVNWASLIDIINTLGGVTITLDEDISDYNYTGIVMKAGVPTEINGEQALGLARARHGTQGGDFTRGNTQQKIVEAIVDKVIQKGVDIPEALSLLSILGDNLRTNFSTDNVKAGVRLISGFDISKIRQVPLVDYSNNIAYVKTATINNVSYVVPAIGERDYDDIQEYIAKMLNDNELSREEAQIRVYNAAGGYGVASAERGRLEADGFIVAGIDDTAAENCAEEYCLYALNTEKTATKAALEERYGVVAHPAEELPTDIWPEYADFVVILGTKPQEL